MLLWCLQLKKQWLLWGGFGSRAPSWPWIVWSWTPAVSQTVIKGTAKRRWTRLGLQLAAAVDRGREQAQAEQQSETESTRTAKAKTAKVVGLQAPRRTHGDKLAVR